MQLLKCIVVYTVIATIGITKASASYVPTPVPDTEKGAPGKTKSQTAEKKTRHAKSKELLPVCARLPIPVRADGEEIAWGFRTRMLLN